MKTYPWRHSDTVTCGRVKIKLVPLEKVQRRELLFQGGTAMGMEARLRGEEFENSLLKNIMQYNSTF